MKKSFILVILVLITCVCFAYDYVTNWSEPATIGSGNTSLVSAVSGDRIIVRDIILSVKNACSLYFYSDGTSDTQISPTFHFAANDGYDSRMARSPLNWETISSEGLGINCSADPETKIQIIYDIKD